MSRPEGSLKEVGQDVGKQEAGKNFRRFLWIIVFVVVIYLIVRNIGAFGNVLLVLLGFGSVVLVHEFGHFVFCKLLGIKVEAFSIGFPPTLAGVLRTENGYRVRILPRFFPKEDDESGDGRLGFTIGRSAKAGETEYRIGLVPFGGFVKMLGQEDVGLVKTSDDPRSFANKPVGARMGVLAAGVAFNVISAVAVFMIIFLIGIRLTAPVVGGVLANSPAARAGIKAGDEVIKIGGKGEDLDFSNIGLAAALSDVNEAVALRVRHKDGSEEDFPLVAEQRSGMPLKVFGIMIPQSLTIAKVRDQEKLLKRTGLRPGDRIKSVNGRDVHKHWELAEIVGSTFMPEVTLHVERGEATSVELIQTRIGLEVLFSGSYEVESESELYHVCSMVPRLRVTAYSEMPEAARGGSLVSKIGRKIGGLAKAIWHRVLSLVGQADTKAKAGPEPPLLAGDIILAVGDIEDPTYKEIREVVEKSEDTELAVKVLRDVNGVVEELLVTVVPRRRRLGETDWVQIGATMALDAEHPVVAKTIGPAKLEIPAGATVMAVDGTPVSNFYDIIREIGRYPGERITIDWREDEETAGSVALDVGAAEEFVTVQSTFAEFVPFKPLERLYQASGPIDAIGMGYKKTVMFIAQTYVTLRRLVGGLVSPKQLIGPVGILTVSYTIVSERPLVYYVYFLGLISACIAVINFLPLPPLDGGLVVLLLIEKIKGSALSERTQGIIAYAGWVFIGAFFLYVTFNDIVRSVRGFF
ncbi:MAG: site-2 protease family protein [Planctomycetota bacterium]|jgi:regulator of sigma E protease